MMINSHKWDNELVAWLEEDLQIAVTTAVRRIEKKLNSVDISKGFTFAADMNGGKRNLMQGAKAKMMGIRPGETDLRFYIHGGFLWCAELKLDRGKLSPEQKDRHSLLGSLGFAVTTHYFKTPYAAVCGIVGDLALHLGCDKVELMQIANIGANIEKNLGGHHAQ